MREERRSSAEVGPFGGRWRPHRQLLAPNGNIVGPDGTNGWSLKRRILNVGSQHQFCQPQIAEY